MEILHKFSVGRSGCPVSLIEYHGKTAVLKENLKNVNKILELNYNMDLPTPKIYEHTETSITMEYINGISIKTFLEHADKEDIHRLIDYITRYFDFAVMRSSPKEFRSFMEQKVKSLEPYGVNIPINKTNLLSGIVHGDFTFDNIIYSDGKFYMIDLTPSENTGIHFDANKLRQDLTGHWFIRNEINTTNTKMSCDIICAELSKDFSFLFDDDLYRFMFARVLPYCQNEKERDFIRNALCKL